LATRVRPQGQEVRNFILRHLKSEGLAAKVSDRFDITRQAANKHLRNLVDENAIVAVGATRNRAYKPVRAKTKTFTYQIADSPEEDVVWRMDIKPLLASLPQNVLDIWQWAFTEMFNNAVDHSEGKEIIVEVKKSAVDAEVMIMDNGVGIFRKLQRQFGLSDERQAILELSKGKLTTDPSRHSGQGIFFTSRMVDQFAILSGETYFAHDIGEEDDWLLESTNNSGTSVFLKVDNHTSRTTRKILAQYSVNNSYGFNKTVVPVELARYGTDQLVSRSQAKRVLARVDQFAQVLFDFRGVDEIGQAFADEIFRVFAQAHPKISLLPINANKTIMGMYRAAIKSARPGYKGPSMTGTS